MTRLKILFVLAAGAVFGAACGSSDESTNSPTGGAGGSDAGAEASAGSGGGTAGTGATGGTGGTGGAVDGLCGGADGVATSVAPTSDLCGEGTSSDVSGTGPWTWTCSGANGGATASCEAPVTGTVVDGACGSADGVATSVAPASGLCSAGTPSALSGTGPWSWTCAGANGGSTVDCSAPLESSAPVDGACGSADGAATSAAPTTGLCSAGTPTAVTGSGPWSWSCTGANGGTTASCSAPLSQVEAPGPSATFFANHPDYTCVTNRYVATAANGGSDSNDGTAPTAGGGHGPWLTLNHANSTIPDPAPGWCINIGDGTYTVNSDIWLDRGGDTASMTGFTVYRAMNLLGAKFVATSSAWNMLNIGAPFLIIDGIELEGAKKGSGITTCFNGFGFNGIHHVAIFNSYIHNMGEGGIGHCWAEYYRVIHNRLDENAFNSWYSGVSIYEPVEIPSYTPTNYDKRWDPYHIVIAYNRCYGNFTSPAGGPHTDGNGIIYDDTQHEQNALNVSYGPKGLIMGNVSWSNGGAGIQVGPTSANADVFNNTAYKNYQDTNNTGTWRGEISSSIGRGNTFKNNIGYSVPGSGILSNASPFLGGNPVDGTNAWANNIAFGADPEMNSPDSFPAPPNKVDTDPKLADVAGGNFALKSGSPAIGFGVVVPYWHQQTAGAIDVGACPHELSTCP